MYLLVELLPELLGSSLKALVQGTPDEIRLRNFRQQWNASNPGIAAKMDFEASVQ